MALPRDGVTALSFEAKDRLCVLTGDADLMIFAAKDLDAAAPVPTVFDFPIQRDIGRFVMLGR